MPPFNNPTPEQVFLAKNYDENSKRTDKDPRGAFRNPVDNPTAGIVGPMGTSSFNLPNVERALSEMEGGINLGASTNSLSSSTGGDPSRKISGRSSGRPLASNLSVPIGAPGTTGRSHGASPTLGTTPSPTGSQTQHEVLQNFFASLLNTKDRPPGTGRPAGPRTNDDSAEDEGS